MHAKEMNFKSIVGRAQLQGYEADQWLSRVRDGAGGCGTDQLQRGKGSQFRRGDRMLGILIRIITQLYIIVKTHQTGSLIKTH